MTPATFQGSAQSIANRVSGEFLATYEQLSMWPSSPFTCDTDLLFSCWEDPDTAWAERIG
jgi:hypothetical protein